MKNKDIGVMTRLVGHKTPEKTKWRGVSTVCLKLQGRLAYWKGRIHSSSNSNDRAHLAHAFAETLTGRSGIYSNKIGRKFEKKLKPLMMECHEYAVDYDAAEARIHRTVASIPSEPWSMRRRRRFNAQSEREYLYRMRTAIRAELSRNLEAIGNLTKMANIDKALVRSRTKVCIYQYIRGLTKGKADLSLLGEDKIDEMIAAINPDVTHPDTSRYEEIVNEQEVNSYV